MPTITLPKAPARPAATPSGQRPWLVLLAQLPDEPTARMRMLRRLEAMGCGVLRDGTYLLPGTSENESALAKMGEHISSSGGGHHLLHVSSDEAQSQAFERCFDRSSRYAEVVKVVSTLKSAFSMADPTSISRTLIKCKRDFAAIASLDFFPSEARDKAAQAIEDCDAAVRGLLFPKSKELSSTQQLRAREKYFRRFWVTRSPLFADRLACAWLIRRFIDAEGKILWINRDQKPHENAVTFGFQGAAFSNSSGEVTYEVLLGAFGLTRDPALKRIATIIHALDIGGEPVPEAAGVESLLQGAQRRATDEQTLLSETEKTFDLLYDAYFVQPGKS